MVAKQILKKLITLWLFNIAMDNGPFIDGLPGFTELKNGWIYTMANC